MITAAISAILGAVLGFLIFRKTFAGDNFSRVLFTFILGAIGLGLGILIASEIGGLLPQRPVVIKETKIVSLINDKSFSGGFILGTGTIEEKEHYFYFEVTPEGKYKRGSAEVEHTLIVEEESLEGEGKLVEFESRFKRDSDYLWGFPRRGSSDKELHIPKGTIVRSFVLR